MANLTAIFESLHIKFTLCVRVYTKYICRCFERKCVRVPKFKPGAKIQPISRQIIFHFKTCMSEISQEAICSLRDQLYKRRVKDLGQMRSKTPKLNQTDMQISGFSFLGWIARRWILLWLTFPFPVIEGKEANFTYVACSAYFPWEIQGNSEVSRVCGRDYSF